MNTHLEPLVRAGLVTCALIVGVGCTRSEAKPAKPTLPQGTTGDDSERFEEEEATPAETSEPDSLGSMHANFFLSGDAHSALVDGDLERAREAARELATQMSPQAVPDTLEPYVVRLKQRADALAATASILEGGKALGLLALACADCHVHLGAGPTPMLAGPVPRMEPPEDIGWRMFRNAVGIDQMWLGMVIPSEETFRDGTTTLAHAPTAPPQAGGQPIDAESHAAIEEIRTLAEQARAAATPEQRAEAYGQVIARCGSCHGGP